MKEKTPGIAYQAISMLRSNKTYGETLADALRPLKGYDKEKLEKSGITNEGKINTEGIWTYVNNVAKDLLKKQNLDPNDPRWLASYQSINSLVKQFGKKGVTTDLIEAIIGTYIQTSTNYVAEKDQQTFASTPTKQGKEETIKLAKITGNNVVYGPWIQGAVDPTEVAGIKGQLEGPLREKVTTAIATSTLEELLKAA